MIMLIFRSRAPLRISFAGGGTDMPPYCVEHGGQVISTTIDKYIYVTVIFNNSDKVHVHAYDLKKDSILSLNNLEYDGNFDIIKAVLKFFEVKMGCDIHIHSDLPAGSGMGTSSSLTVALVSLFATYRHKNLTKRDIAEIACQIERKELKQAGGYQDQYAASYGGFNYIKFGKTHYVYPLFLSSELYEELNYRMILCYTGTTHVSAEVQSETLLNYESVDFQEGMKLLKLRANQMKDFLNEQDIKNIEEFGKIQHLAWIAKKQLNCKISNAEIEKLYLHSLKNGAIGGKLLGAGGGGFLLLFVDPIKKLQLIKELEEIGGKIINFRFEKTGVISWKVSD
jgi:D-glycero-alpha-D-manno-heptose-7-phosphate kinase